MKRRYLILIVCLIGLIGAGSWIVVRAGSTYEEKLAQAQLDEQIQSVIDLRRSETEADDQSPFDDQGVLRLLLLGLDTRFGETIGHCDAIQFVEIDRDRQSVTITAVPRGTYAPLPGSGHLPSDYYVSNACGIGGLEYGIEQIEKILGKNADYVAMIGFSETLGLLRSLNLPATETLQWLRLRQSYAIGEPQRAHNHSTFLKQLLEKFVPESTSKIDTAWQYLIFRLIQTDLSFTQSQEILLTLSAMDLANHPERITLAMRPEYPVTDIMYDPENLDAYLTAMLNPIAEHIPEGAYTGITEDEEQQKIMDLVNAGLEHTDFVVRAFEQKLWLQLNDEATRESVHFALLGRYLPTRSADEQQVLLADYIIEMEVLGQTDWAEEGRSLLAEIVSDTP